MVFEKILKDFNFFKTKYCMEKKNKVCIVGAGPSGLCQAKKLVDEGQECVIFEKLDIFGGQWVYFEDDSPSVHSSCYKKNLKSATPPLVMQFEDFPMSSDYPKLCSWQQVLKYTSDYVEKFDLKKLIKFNHTVLSIKFNESNSNWNVLVEHKEKKKRRINIYTYCNF